MCGRCIRFSYQRQARQQGRRWHKTERAYSNRDRREIPSQEATMSNIMSSLLVLVLILSWIPLTCPELAMNMNQYQAVRMTPGGPAVCAFDNPTATHIGLIISLCSTKCSRNDNCLYYNYHIPPNQQPVCQLFDFHPQSVAAMDNCVLFAVSHTRLLLRFRKLESCLKHKRPTTQCYSRPCQR